MKSTKRNEVRLAGEWQAEVKISKLDIHSGVSRKVLTNGIVKIVQPELLNKLQEYLRAGKEVRLVDGNGDDAIRFFPCADKFCEKIEVVATTMGEFRNSLSDIPMRRVMHRKECSAEEVSEAISEHYEKRNKSARQNVTPDTVVTCPSCGTEFRVGKQLV